MFVKPCKTRRGLRLSGGPNGQHNNLIVRRNVCYAFLYRGTLTPVEKWREDRLKVAGAAGAGAAAAGGKPAVKSYKHYRKSLAASNETAAHRAWTTSEKYAGKAGKRAVVGGAVAGGAAAAYNYHRNRQLESAKKTRRIQH